MSDQVDSKVVGIVCDGNHGQNWLLDVRCRWPKMFEMFCCCDKGWGGYDCSECDFGYIDNGAGQCVEQNANQLLVRRNFMELSNHAGTK